VANRRQVLQLGIAASVLPLSARAFLSRPAVPEAAAIPLYRTVYDARFRAARAFAARARMLGARLKRIDGDITDLWYNDLDLRWKQGPVAIAGLTDTSALFCLEHLAWGAGRLRVVYRADHWRHHDGRVMHRMPKQVAAATPPLGADPAEWGRRAADLIVLHRGSERTEAASMGGNASSRASSDTAAEHLVSWIIAPVRRA
jgi:hypothetical protein